MKSVAPALLRPTLALVGLGTLVAQILIPLLASEVGQRHPEVRGLVVPYSWAAILAVLCAQVIIVAVWRLLSMTSAGRIFTPAALSWVDAVVASLSVGTVLSGLVLLHLAFFAKAGGAGTVLALAGLVGIGTAFALLMVVMRGLLVMAIRDHGELEDVI